jgi:WD40 repeat protein
MSNVKATAMKRNLTASMILLGVQLLLWKGVPIISHTPHKDSPIPESSTVSKILQTTLKGHALKVSSVAITTDNNTVISGSEDNTIKIWDAKTGQLKRTLTGHTGVVNYLSVTPNRKYLVSAEDKNVKIWNLLTGALIRDIQNLNSKINFIKTSQDGQTLVMDGGTKIIKNTTVNLPGSTYPSETKQITKYIINVFDLQTGYLKNQLVHDNLLTQFEISRSSNILVSGDSTGKLNIWNLQTGTLQKTFTGHESEIKSIGISLDEKTIVSTDKDGKIKIWDLIYDKLKSTFTGHNVESYDVVTVLIPNNNTLVSWNKNILNDIEDVKIWNLENGNLKYILNKPVEQTLSIDKFAYVTVSPDARNMITKKNKSIQMWELATGNLKDTIEIDGSILTFSPDTKILATLFEDNTINLWRIPANNKVDR